MSVGPDDPRVELARERTDAAQRRTLLAEERTYSAWVRTGLASIVTGFAIAKFMQDAGPGWLVQTLAATFVAAGGAMFVAAFRRYRGAARRMASERGGRVWLAGGLSLVLALAAAGALVLVLPPGMEGTNGGAETGQQVE